MTTEPRLRIEPAKAIAELVRLLYRLKIISPEDADKYIDHLTVLVLKADLKRRKI
jgi:hypothetical protein